MNTNMHGARRWQEGGGQRSVRCAKLGTPVNTNMHADKTVSSGPAVVRLFGSRLTGRGARVSSWICRCLTEESFDPKQVAQHRHDPNQGVPDHELGRKQSLPTDHIDL